MKYFMHDTNSFSDEKITELFIKFGYEGLGLFYTILERLAYQEKPIKETVLKSQLKVGKKLEKCWTFLESIGLISTNNGETFNENILNFSGKYTIEKEKTRKRVAEWRENQIDEKNVTPYVQESNVHKVNRSKENRSKENRKEESDIGNAVFSNGSPPPESIPENVVSDLEKKIIPDKETGPASPPIVEEKRKKVKQKLPDNLTTFEDSEWADKEKFLNACPQDWPEAKKEHYYLAAQSWSEDHPNERKVNWIKAVVRWDGNHPWRGDMKSNGSIPKGHVPYHKEDPIQSDTITLIIQKFNEYAGMNYDWKDLNIRAAVSDRLLQDASPNDIFDIIQLKSMELGIGEKRQYLTLQSLLSNKNYANYLQQVRDIKEKKKAPNISFQQKAKMQNEAISKAIGQDINSLYK